MNEQEILKEFTDAGAILKGHFILSSSLHSDTYLQCARVLMDAKRAERLCRALADKVRHELEGQKIDMVVAPAMGGLIVGYELARQLGIESMFCERVQGFFAFRRGFFFPEGTSVLVVEDVITTGKSSRETFDCIRAQKGRVIAEACLVDRSNGESNLGIPLISLLTLNVPTWRPEDLPPHIAALPAEKPGSRFLK